MNVEQQSTRRIRRIGCVNFPAGKTPEQIRIDGAEGEFAARRFIGDAGNIAQKPGELGTGEIRIEQKPGLRCNALFMPSGFEMHAQIGGAAILPDDGAMHGAAGRALPQ